jgi:exopolysaccharide biosynthesis predicted pyruvyltransferase EpsI
MNHEHTFQKCRAPNKEISGHQESECILNDNKRKNQQANMCHSFVILSKQIWKSNNHISDQNMLTIRRAKITKLKGLLITVTRLHTNILHSIVQMESILIALSQQSESGRAMWKTLDLINPKLTHPQKQD